MAIKKSIHLEQIPLSTVHYDVSEDYVRALAKSVLLTRAPNLSAKLGFGPFEYYAEVLLECFIEDASELRRRLSQKSFQDDQRTLRLMSKIEKWTEQRLLVCRALYANSKNVIGNVVNVICFYLLQTY